MLRVLENGSEIHFSVARLIADRQRDDVCPSAFQKSFRSTVIGGKKVVSLSRIAKQVIKFERVQGIFREAQAMVSP